VSREKKRREMRYLTEMLEMAEEEGVVPHIVPPGVDKVFKTFSLCLHH
jgi:hypothetical protein